MYRSDVNQLSEEKKRERKKEKQREQRKEKSRKEFNPFTQRQ